MLDLGNLSVDLGSMAIGGWLSAMFALAVVLPVATDEELVSRCKRGDSAAFADLVHRHEHRIYGVCVRWLSDAEAAEEVAQDVFLSAWRAIGTFREEARFDTWLRRIAVNKCKNKRLYHHRRAMDRHDSIDEPEEEGERPRLQLIHGGRGPEAGIESQQAKEALERGLAALPEEQRSIIVLRDMEDLDYEEISSLLGVPRGTVKSRLHRARSALAAALAPYFGTKDVF